MPEMKLDWAPRALLDSRHARVTLAHEAPVAGRGSSYLADLQALDSSAWSLIRLEIREPDRERPPKGFEDLDAALTKLLEAVEGARTNLRTFDEPTDALDALELWEEEVARDVDFGDDIRALADVVRALNRRLEDEADRARDEAGRALVGQTVRLTGTDYEGRVGVVVSYDEANEFLHVEIDVGRPVGCGLLEVERVDQAEAGGAS